MILRSGLAVLTLFSALPMSMQEDPKDAAVRLAKAALTRQLQSDAGAATVSEVREVDWPDSSLGCPVAGEMFAPVITPGHLVRLRFDQKDFEVHVGAGRAVICGAAGGSAQARPKPGANQTASEAEIGLKMAQQARAALASRLGIATSAVTVVSYRATTWPNAGLGCGDKGAAYPPSPTRGFLIQPFRSRARRRVPCEALS